MSRKRSFLLNTVSSISYEVVFLIVGFILPKLFIIFYGSEVNGLVNSITNFLGLVALADLGIGAVVSANYYKPLASKNTHETSLIYSSSLRFYRQLSYILIVYIVLLAIFYPFIVNNVFDHLYVMILILVIALNTFFRYFFGISYTLLLKSDQKQYVYFLINIITLILNAIIVILLIVNNVDILLVKLSTTIVFVLRPILLSVYVKKRYDLVKNLKVKHRLKQKWNGVAQHLAFVVQDNTDIIVLTLFSSLTFVSIYSVYYMVVIGIRGLIYALMNGFSSLIGSLLAKNEKERLGFVFMGYQWSTFFISTLLFGSTLVLIIPFMSIYSKEFNDANYIQPLFASILVIATFIRCIQLPYNTVVQAGMHFKQTQMASILEPIINISISIFLVIQYGLVGVAIGTLISILFRTIYLIFYLRKNLIYIKLSVTIKLTIVHAITLVLIAFFTKLIIDYDMNYVSWIFLSIKVVAFNFALLLIANMVFFPKEINNIRKFVFKREGV